MKNTNISLFINHSEILLAVVVLGIIFFVICFLATRRSSKSLRSERSKIHTRTRKLESKGTEQGREGRRIMKREAKISGELMKRRNK